MHAIRFSALCAAVLTLSPLATAQWNPPTGQWGKIDAADLRVMTWNVQDGICTTQPKTEGSNSWCAIARVIAALKPDVLILQETGDNSGNGTGSGLDTVAELALVVNYLLHGGNDSFNGNAAITAWVRKYAASYDLPYVFVSTENDGFNRNIILSRYPFADQNGDTKATMSDIPTVAAGSAWAPGGDGGIRGFMFAEIDLPNVTYLGNAVVGNAHLKSGGATSDHDQRIVAAQNVGYVIQYWYNGNGGATPDPASRIFDSPVATSVLAANTPVILGGDWNEDEVKSGGATSDHDQRIVAAQNVGYVIQYWYNGNGGATPDPASRISDSPVATSVLAANTPVILGGDWNEDEAANGATRGPVSWLASAQTVGGAVDGTDRNLTDSTADSALHFFSGSNDSHQSGSKLDVLVWQDSIATLRLQTIFISSSNPVAAQPPECVGFAGGVANVTTVAADHRPVFTDLRLPIVDCNGNGIADTTDIANGSLDANANQIPDTCECFAVNYCQTSPNSVGAGAIMDSAGTLSLSANNLILIAYDAPPNASALYFYGQNETQVPFGNGFRCIGNPVTRLGILQIDGLGTAFLPLDFTSGSLTQVAPASTWSFQLWYRNPLGGGAGFNLSDGRRFLFCP